MSGIPRPRKCACGRTLIQPPTGRTRRFCSDACRAKAYRRRKRPVTPGGPRLAAMFTSKTDEWPTPQAFFDQLNAEFDFTLDVAATAENAKCERYFTRADDGLAQEWTGRVWANPPYGRPLAAWIRKAYEASQTTAEVVVCLIPARTSTRWWHEYVEPARLSGDVRFIPGRLRFGDAKHNAPFASVVVMFRNAATPRTRLLSVTKGGADGCRDDLQPTPTREH